jgi:hypothetical protein
VRSVRRRRSGCAGIQSSRCRSEVGQHQRNGQGWHVSTTAENGDREVRGTVRQLPPALQHYEKVGALQTRASAGAARWRQKANHRNAALVLEHLTSAACIDCAIADPLVLQFDHRPGEIKVKDIGWFVSSGSRMGLLLDELAKCDVRCANCHRRRTAQGRGWFRARVANASGM